MGATVWMYVTGYDDDPERALHRLRGEVFREGSYRRPWEFPDVLSGLYGLPNLRWKGRLLLWTAESFFTTLEMVRWAFWGFRRVRTLEQAVEWAGEDGTHSILDVARTGMYRRAGVAAPLSEPRLRQIFGTARPTLQALEEQAGRISCSLPRREAVYFPVYEGERPTHLAFIGVSGD